MSDVNDLFSSEVLRLLEESGIDYGTVLWLDPPAEYIGSSTPTQCEAQFLHPLQHVPGCSSLSLGDLAKSKRKRAKFGINAREKVAAVRKKGACLRCRALKLPVGLTSFDSTIH